MLENLPGASEATRVSLPTPGPLLAAACGACAEKIFSGNRASYTCVGNLRNCINASKCYVGM